MSRFVRPETTVLSISDGDTLTVKNYLTHGEQSRAYARMYRAGGEGVDPQMVALSMVLAYLLDWSLTDDAGQQVLIRDKSDDDVRAVLESLHTDDFDEIREAIKAHEGRMAAARQEKKRPNGTPVS